MTASKVFLDQLHPTAVAMEGTYSASALFSDGNEYGKAFLTGLDILGVTVRELPEERRTFFGIEVEGEPEKIAQMIPTLEQKADAIAELTGVGAAWGSQYKSLVHEAVADIKRVPADASLMRYIGAFSSSFAEELAPSDDGCVYMFGRSGSDYKANRPAKHEDNNVMGAACIRDIGGMFVNWSGLIQPQGELSMHPFSLYIPSLDHAKLQGLAAGRESSVQSEIETAIENFADTYDGSPVEHVDMSDQAGSVRRYIQPLLLKTEKLAHLPSASDPERNLPLGVALRAAIRYHLEYVNEA